MKTLLLPTLILISVVAYSQESISVNDAGKYVNQVKQITGKVVHIAYAKKKKGQPTMIFLDKAPESNPASIVIWGWHRKNFPYKPEVYLLNKEVTITALVESFNDKPLIIVVDDEQIKFVSQERPITRK